MNLLVTLTLSLVPLIIAISFHEFSHIAMARWLGDDTGTRMGRYTLDPLKHIDPLWTVALPAILIITASMSGAPGIPFFAAGKPAPYNPMRLTRSVNGKRLSLRTAEMLVAVAGPLSNLFLAIISTVVYVALLKVGMDSDSPFAPINLAGRFLVLNVSLFIFNLIPIPPLDGSKVLVSFLPRDAARTYETWMQQASLLLFGLLIFSGGAWLSRAVGLVVNLLVRPFT